MIAQIALPDEIQKALSAYWAPIIANEYGKSASTGRAAGQAE